MAKQRAPADMLAAQARAKLFALIAILTTIGGIAWAIAGRVVVEPERVLIAISLGDPQDATTHWWGGDPGAAALHHRVSNELTELGLIPLISEERPLEAMVDHFTAASAHEAQERAEALGIGTVVLGSVEVLEVLPLEGTPLNDLTLSLSVEVLDLQSGERKAVPGSPVRLFVSGVDASDAIARNANHVTQRLIMPLAEALASLPGLAHYAQLPAEATTTERLVQARLRPLHVRASNYRTGLEQHASDLRRAKDNQAAEAGPHPRLRLSGLLDEEFWIGDDAEGHALLMRQQLHVTVPPHQLGYKLVSESERIDVLEVLPRNEDELDAVGTSMAQGRRTLFEHYNFFSFPSVSRAGTHLACVLSNHGASKTLAILDTAQGHLTPLLTDPHEYYSTPVPSPDGDQVTFFSRPQQRAPSALEVYERGHKTRQVLVEAGPAMTPPQWTLDGAHAFVGLTETPRAGPHAGSAVGRILRFDRQVLGDGEGGAPEARPAPRYSTQTVLGPDLEVDPTAAQEALTMLLLDVPEDEAPQAEAERLAKILAMAPALSNFGVFALAADDAGIFVAEEGALGAFIGHFNFANGSYKRLAQLDARRMVAHPTDPRRVAIEAYGDLGRYGRANASGEASDLEVFVVDLDGKVEAITVNEVDDALAGWARDGSAIYTQQQDPEAYAQRHPVRVFRHDMRPSK